MSSKKALFGGSFDPIHLGHLNLALTLLERHKLDEVFFCPANLSPLKQNEPPSVSAEHRRAMVELAIAPVEQFTLLDFELTRPGPSYTIDTVRHLLQKLGKGVKLYLMLGEDALQGLAKWKEVDELVKLAPPLLGSRGSVSAQLPPALLHILEKGVTKIPEMEISSTDIRKRLRAGQYCGHLLPAEVLTYIQRHKIYEN